MFFCVFLWVWDKEKILNPYVIGIVTDSLVPSYDNPFIPWSDSKYLQSNLKVTTIKI